MLFGFTGLVVGPLSLGLFMTLVRFHKRDVVQTARQAAVGANQNAEAPAA